MSCGLAPRSSTRSGAASNRTPSGTAATNTTRCIESESCATRHRTPHRPAAVPHQHRLTTGDPDWELTVVWQCYQRLQPIYHATRPAAGRRLAEEVITSLPSCPIPEVARLGRTLRPWRPQLLAYFSTDGVNNGGTEAINLIIEKPRRLAHGFGNLTHYKLRILPPAAHGPTGEDPPMHSSEEPDYFDAGGGPHRPPRHRWSELGRTH
jgi:Transposase